MMKFLRRLFAGAAPETNAEQLGGGGHSQRGGIIENREPPIPGVIEVASADVISQIFDGDATRQEAEHMSRAMRRFERFRL
jgi:hypothetical protein